MSWFKARTDPVAEEIVDDIAMMAASSSDLSKETQRMIDMMLFSAAVICYRQKTEFMGTDASVAYVQGKIDKMVEAWKQARANM